MSQHVEDDMPVSCWLVEEGQSLLMLLSDDHSSCAREPALISVLNEKLLLNVHG